MSQAAQTGLVADSVARCPRILVIGDDESIRFLLNLYLRNELEAEIICATCVSDGKLSFLQNQVDIIICDQNMGDGVGIEVLRFIRERDPGFPFILYTAQFRDELPELDSFECCYVQKPELGDLLDQVEVQLGGRHGRK